MRFFTAASLVNRLEEAQKQYQLDKFLTHLSGRANDGGPAGSPEAPLPYLRYERRELPVWRIGEEE